MKTKVLLTPMQRYINNGEVKEYFFKTEGEAVGFVDEWCKERNYKFEPGDTEAGGIGYDYRIELVEPLSIEIANYMGSIDGINHVGPAIVVPTDSRAAELVLPSLAKCRKEALTINIFEATIDMREVFIIGLPPGEEGHALCKMVVQSLHYRLGYIKPSTEQ